MKILDPTNSGLLNINLSKEMLLKNLPDEKFMSMIKVNNSILSSDFYAVQVLPTDSPNGPSTKVTSPTSSEQKMFVSQKLGARKGSTNASKFKS